MNGRGSLFENETRNGAARRLNVRQYQSYKVSISGTAPEAHIAAGSGNRRGVPWRIRVRALISIAGWVRLPACVNRRKKARRFCGKLI
jgi:hypothetical protein